MADADDVPLAGPVSILGGWTQQTADGCRQTLAFDSAGGFRFGVATHLQGYPIGQHVAGSFSGGPLVAEDGTLTGDLAPSGPAAEPALTGCAAWGAVTQITLPFADWAQAGGADGRTLHWRPIVRAGGGQAWVGTDDAATDRLALVPDGALLRAFTPEAGLAPGVTLYHRRAPDLSSQYGLAFGSLRVVHLPQQSHAETFTATAGGQVLRLMLLVVRSSVRVTFSSQGGATSYPLCVLRSWDSVDFGGAPLLPDPLANIAAMPAVVLNPGDPATPLRQATVTIAGQPDDLYVLPLEVRAGAAGMCDLNIRARPWVALRAEELLAQPTLSDAFNVPLTGVAAYLVGQPEGRPGTVGLVPLTGRATWEATALQDRIALIAAPPADPLGLGAGDARTVRLSLDGPGGQRALSVFPVEDGIAAATGMGPLTPHVPQPATPLSLPASQPVTFAGGSPLSFSFSLGAQAVVDAYAQAATPLTATLWSADGIQLAATRGQPDATLGFRLVAALAAGDYVLQLRAVQPPLSTTLQVALPAGEGLADPALEACLRAANGFGASPQDLRVADCRGRAVSDLTGIEAYGALRALQLDGSALSDLTPLSGLPALDALSLQGSTTTDLAPLTTVPRLHRLSLAGAALDADDAATLATLALRLTYLDLAGASGLSDAELAALKAALPNSMVIAPDGTALE